MGELVVVEHEDLQSLRGEVSHWNVEDELLLKLRVHGLLMDATLELALPVRKQTQSAEGIGGSTEVTCYEVTCLDETDGQQRLFQVVGKGEVDGAEVFLLDTGKVEALQAITVLRIDQQEEAKSISATNR